MKENIRTIFVFSCEFPIFESNSGNTFEYSKFRLQIEYSSHPYAVHGAQQCVKMESARSPCT